MKGRYRVISKSPLWVKKTPESTGKNIAVLQPNAIIDVTTKANGYLRYSGGWVPEYNSSGDVRFLQNLSPSAIAEETNIGISTFSIDSGEQNASNVSSSTQTMENGSTIVTTTNSQGQTVRSYWPTTDKTYYDSDDDGDVSSSSYADALSNIDIKELRGVYGMPYQWMEHVDPRLNDKEFGRMYAKRIVARLPLMIIAPGEPEFLAGYSEEEKSNVFQAAIGVIRDKLTNVSGGQSELDRLLNSEGKYYSFKYAGNAFYRYVNPMLRTAATVMGLGDEKYFDQSLSSFDWRKNYNPGVYQYWTGRKALAFYIDSETQISDTFGNSDTPSALASKVNGFSDMAREMQFLLGGASAATGLQVDAISSQGLLNNQENVGDITTNVIGGNSAMNQLLKQITGGFQTVLAGGKLIFPNIWSDSEFFRSYDVNFKFVSPDYDDYSWYINILVPVCMLLGLVMPRQSGPNGFLSPFLVRAFYKGLFNCDMGLVTNLSIQKGAEGGWTKSGLPTVVNCSMTIKDLYSNISMTESTNVERNILTNSIFMDYLCNFCGININEPDIVRTITLYYQELIRNPILDIPQNIMGALDTTAMNWIMNSFGRALRI